MHTTLDGKPVSGAAKLVDGFRLDQKQWNEVFAMHEEEGMAWPDAKAFYFSNDERYLGVWRDSALTVEQGK